jgi:hypothetical protein
VLLATDPVFVAVQAVDVSTDDIDRLAHIGRPITTATRAVHVAGGRYASSEIVGVALLSRLGVARLGNKPKLGCATWRD